MVRNLVENAERDAPRAVRLELRRVTTDGSPRSSWSVSDDGPGVPLEHREHIFDRFIRLDDARSRPDEHNSGGSGLGLAICREIVTAHGGRIWADEAQGGGARFIVQIPAGRRRLATRRSSWRSLSAWASALRWRRAIDSSRP